MLKILFASNICLLARGPPAQNVLSIFVVVNQIWFTIQRAGRKSESVLIHSQKRAFFPKANQCLIHSHISPRHTPCGADAPHRTRTRWTPQTRRLARLWGCGAAWTVQLTT